MFNLLSFLFAFSLLFCCYLMFIRLFFIPFVFSEPLFKVISCPASVLGKLDSQSRRAGSHCGRRSDILTWLHAGHIRVRCKKGGCGMCTVFISPSLMTVSLWMPRLRLPVSHFHALTWEEAVEALSCKIGSC